MQWKIVKGERKKKGEREKGVVPQKKSIMCRRPKKKKGVEGKEEERKKWNAGVSPGN